jgi:transcription termination/antitermination protein NusG
MPWYALYTRSRHEDRVNLLLLQKSFNAFLPKIEVWSKRKDRRKKILIPMFPGYLFIEIPQISNEIKIDVLKTFGVVRILGKPRSADPFPVPEEKIDAIRRIAESRVDVVQMQYPSVGEGARIIEGPFKGIDGLVVKADYQKELFVITIDLLQRSIAVKLEGFAIEKL